VRPAGIVSKQNNHAIISLCFPLASGLSSNDTVGDDYRGTFPTIVRVPFSPAGNAEVIAAFTQAVVGTRGIILANNGGVSCSDK